MYGTVHVTHVLVLISEEFGDTRPFNFGNSYSIKIHQLTKHPPEVVELISLHL